jgi:hypothetical protein
MKAVNQRWAARAWAVLRQVAFLVGAAALLLMSTQMVGCKGSPFKAVARMPVQVSKHVRKHAPLPLAVTLAAGEGVMEKVFIPMLP